MDSRKVVFQVVCELHSEKFNRRWGTIKNIGVMESKQFIKNVLYGIWKLDQKSVVLLIFLNSDW